MKALAERHRAGNIVKVDKKLEAPDSLPISWCEFIEDPLTAIMKANLKDILAIKHIQRFLAELPRYKNDCVSFGVPPVIVEMQLNILLSDKEIAIDL